MTETLTPRLTRRKFVRWALRLGMGLTLGGSAYGGFVEPNHLAIERIDIRLKRLPATWDGLRIVQLGDFHRGPYVQDYQVRAAVDATNALNPDLVLLVGDYIVWSGDENAWPCAQELARLRAPLGVVAVLGNHDYWADGD